MTPTFTYEQAILLQRIIPLESLPDGLCALYYCRNCPTYQSQAVEEEEKCTFSQAYAGGYREASIYTRRDMRLQFPPEQYPELYI